MEDLIARLKRDKGPTDLSIQGLWGSAKAFFWAKAFGKLNRSLLFVCAGRHEAEDWVENLKTCFALSKDISPLILEGWELPSTQSRQTEQTKPSLENASERCLVLEQLLHGQGPCIIVATLSGALGKLLAHAQYERMRMEVHRGKAMERDIFIQTLAQFGYERSPMVEKKGDFCVHGGVVDVYPVGHPDPLRLEWSGDEVESLRAFDSLSQRSCGQLGDGWILRLSDAWPRLSPGLPKPSTSTMSGQQWLPIYSTWPHLRG